MEELTFSNVGINFPNADGSNRRSEATVALACASIELAPKPKDKHNPNVIPVIGTDFPNVPHA